MQFKDVVCTGKQNRDSHLLFCRTFCSGRLSLQQYVLLLCIRVFGIITKIYPSDKRNNLENITLSARLYTQLL